MTLLDHVSDGMVSYVRYKPCVPILHSTPLLWDSPYIWLKIMKWTVKDLLFCRDLITQKSDCGLIILTVAQRGVLLPH